MRCFLKFVFHQGYPERCTEMQGSSQDCCCTSAQASVAYAFERIAGDSQREKSETLL